jgi:hypothetical protein
MWGTLYDAQNGLKFNTSILEGASYHEPIPIYTSSNRRSRNLDRRCNVGEKIDFIAKECGTNLDLKRARWHWAIEAFWPI